MANCKSKMHRFIKNIFIFKIVLYILIINSFIYLTAFSQTNIGNFFVYNEPGVDTFSKERQLISVNLLPRHSAIFPTFVNSLTRNIETFAGLAKIQNLNDIKLYNNISAKDILNSVDIKGNFWYIPDISYTFLFNRNIGIEAGIGVQSVSYSLNISKDKLSSILETGGLEIKDDALGELPISTLLDALNGENIHFKASFVYIPIHFGFKFFLGKTHKVVNTFRIGLETVVYNVETENIISGKKTIRSSAESTFYISYELGWQIDLFPNKNWRVKPYIDISLFEIGCYIRTAYKGIYNDIKEGISFLTDTSSLSVLLSPFGINTGGWANSLNFLPEWDTFPRYVDFITSLKIAIFPRIGFTIRF